MRNTALSVSVAGLALAVAGLCNAGEFDALLADLSFGDAPVIATELKQPKPDVAPTKPDQELKPAPHGMTMPSLDVTPISSPIDDVPQPEAEATESAAEMVAPAEAPLPMVDPTLQAPLTSPSDAPGAVNFQEAFAAQESIPSAAVIAPPQPAVPCDSGCATDAGCDSCRTSHSESICRPYVRPNLPNSTLLQYFRSNRCYSRIWDGYRQRCPSSLNHVDGTCDCFDKKKQCGCGPVLAPACNTAACDACDR